MFFDNSNKNYDRAYRPITSYSTLLTSNIFNAGGRKMKQNESFIKSSRILKGFNESRILKSQIDTTIFSSQMKNTRNISYAQLSNIIQKSEKKSCVFGCSAELIGENPIKHSTVLHR